MRRVAGYVLVMLGLLLVFLGPLFRWYVTPRVEKAQVDIYDRSVSEGIGQYFIVAQASLSEPHLLQNVTITRADPERSTGDVGVYEQFSRTLDLETGRDIDFSLETYAMDRSTGVAVHCCGENPPKEGHTLKFPFNVEKISYDFYDSTARRAFPTEFQGEEEVAGLNTYRFVVTSPPTLLTSQSVPGFIMGMPEVTELLVQRFYEATTTLWVEPRTGAVIKGSQQARQWLHDAGTDTEVTIAQTDFTNVEASIEHTAARIRNDAGQLDLVGIWIPIFGPVAGVILVVVGLLLLRETPTMARARRQPEPATA